MKYAILGLAVGIATLALTLAGITAGSGHAQDPGVAEDASESGLFEIPPTATAVVAAPEPPQAPVEPPAPQAPAAPAAAPPIVQPAAPAPATSGAVTLPAAGSGGESDIASATRLLLYAAGLVVMGTLIVAAARRRI